VFVPKALRIRGALDQLGGASGKLDPNERPMTEDIAHAVAELIAHLGDPLVSRTAIGACVAAIFDERDGGVRGTENVVGLVIHWPIEPIAQRHVRHRKIPRSGSDDDNGQREQAFQRLALQSMLPDDRCNVERAALALAG
jgi:hypothetical protein